MSDMEWENYRDTAVFIHAVNTIGATFFATVITGMMLSGTAITHETFDKEIHDVLDYAREKQGHDGYLRAMLAHAYFERNVRHKLR